MTVNNLHELQAMSPGVDRVKAADDYIEARLVAVKAAREIRDVDIRQLVEEHGPAKAARLVGRSLTTIKLIRGRS